MMRKPGVSEPDELESFVEAARDRLVVIDVRKPEEASEVGPIPSDSSRPLAINLEWDREAASMPLPDATRIPLDTPIITHCGGGGRGQKAKLFLEKHGYTNVRNGGGPEDPECWKHYGHK